MQHMEEDERVILVNEQDEPTGTMEKLEAHRRGVLHRAFSVFLFDGDGRLLLQQRSATKYHSASLWTNTCCSHPRPGEATAAAAMRRLKEEMGLEADLEHRFAFTYEAAVGNDLREHEYDHVFFGIAASNPVPAPAEVRSWRFVSLPDLRAEMEADPHCFTAWLHHCLPLVQEHFQQQRA